jgi:putative spermidine/putrescine transport system substrate-binding protein
MTINRRDLIKAAAAGTTLGWLGQTPALAQDKSIKIISWGGSYGEAMRSAWMDPFTAASGIRSELRLQSGMMETLASLRANKGRIDDDLWVTGVTPTVLAKQDGLLEPIPVGQLKNAGQLPAEMVNETYVGVWRLPFGIIYNPETVPFEITKWTDLFDERLKGKLTAPQGSGYNGRFIALLAWLAGGDENNVDPGFELAKKLTPNVSIFTSADPEQVRLLSSGEVDVAAFAPVGNYISLRKSAPQYRFVCPKPYIPMSFNNIVILKGANVAAATAFIDFIIGKEPQEKIAEMLGFLPMNEQAELPAALRELVPPGTEVRYPDEVAIADKLTAWADRWQQEIQR